MIKYYSARKISNGMYRVSDSAIGEQPWLLVTVKKDHICASGDDKVIAAGDKAYRPITNASNRMDRISVREMERLEYVATRLYKTNLH